MVLLWTYILTIIYTDLKSVLAQSFWLFSCTYLLVDDFLNSCHLQSSTKVLGTPGSDNWNMR